MRASPLKNCCRRLSPCTKQQSSCLLTRTNGQNIPFSCVFIRNGGSCHGGTLLATRPMHALAKRAIPPHLIDGIPQETEVEADQSPLPYTETDLELLYRDLLSTPARSTSEEKKMDEINVIASLVDRFSLHDNGVREDSASLSARLAARRETRVAEQSSESLPTLPKPHQLIIFRIRAVVEDAEFLQSSNAIPSTSAAPQRRVRLGVLSNREWDELAKACIREDDLTALEETLDLMMRAGHTTTSGLVNEMLELCALAGNPRAAERVVELATKAPGSTLDEVGRHFHIEAYINSGDLHRTQQLIHSYENRNMAPALRTYNSFISSLLAQKRSDSRALAWDMYAHMRYVAHPTPDSAIYTTMIRGCTMSGASESHAERALDLWTEMTVDNRIAPTQASYNAIILACAKNSKFTHEAFRLAKEMMDAYRDGALHLRPDRNTFRALLENAKRASDLSRARWIFAELLKAEQDESLVPDHDIISLVFQVYACYKPPFRRQALLVQDRQGETPDYNGSASSHDVEDHSDAPAQQPSLSVPPQTHSEVIAEVEALFSRIVSQSAQSGAGTHSEPLSKVQLTTQLLNSYLTVHYAHSTLRTSLELFHRLFDDLEVRRNLWSFIHVMERCSYSQTVEERRLALKVVDVIWREWDAWINELVPSPEKMVARATTIPPRLVERVWRAKIRTLALGDERAKALSTVKAFVDLYPPSSLRTSAPSALALQSSRTSLAATTRPLMRLTSNTQVADENTPPYLTFGDVELLHHRLVSKGEIAEVGYLKYVCKAYVAALGMRRADYLRRVRGEKTDIISQSIASTPKYI